MKTVTQRSIGIITFAVFPRSIKYLLIKQHQGHWGFPKGHTEKGEKYIETAIRELWEETGIKKIEFLEKKILYKEKYLINYPNEKINKLVYFYVAKSLETNVKIDKKELINFKWCPYEKALEKITYTNNKNILKKANKYITAKLKK